MSNNLTATAKLRYRSGRDSSSQAARNGKERTQRRRTLPLIIENDLTGRNEWKEYMLDKPARIYYVKFLKLDQLFLYIGSF